MFPRAEATAEADVTRSRLVPAIESKTLKAKVPDMNTNMYRRKNDWTLSAMASGTGCFPKLVTKTPRGWMSRRISAFDPS